MNPQAIIPPIMSGFISLKTTQAISLGSPLLQGEAMDFTLSTHVLNLKLASERLGCLQSHDAQVIIKHST